MDLKASVSHMVFVGLGVVFLDVSILAIVVSAGFQSRECVRMHECAGVQLDRAALEDRRVAGILVSMLI